MSSISEVLGYPSLEMKVNGYDLTVFVKIHPSDPQFGVPGSEHIMYIFVDGSEITNIVSQAVEDEIYVQLEVLRHQSEMREKVKAWGPK